MYLTFIEKGTPMTIVPGKASGAGEASYDAEFYDMSSDTTFWARNEALYNAVAGSDTGDRMLVAFSRNAYVYTFYARAISVMIEHGAYLTKIEQLTGMEEVNRRSDHRDEITIKVRLFGLNEADITAKRFVKASYSPVFTCETFDVSSGGLCLVSNDALESPFEPYFLCEFALGNERFLLPAKLVRKGDCPQTTLFRHDYGLSFLPEGVEHEKKRLIDALFNVKISSIY